MNKILAMLFVACSMLGFFCFLVEAKEVSKQIYIAGIEEQDYLDNQKENNQTSDNNIDSKNREYRFPSIMVEQDMYSKFISGEEKEGLLLSLTVTGWKITQDRYGVLCKHVSPEITYAELQYALNFNDDDVIVVSDKTIGKTLDIIKERWMSCNYLEFHESLLDFLPGQQSKIVELEPVKPHAIIETEWLTCFITYVNKRYDGKDKAVRLKAIVIDNKVQSHANARAEYDKDKGIIRTILDLFKASPH